MAHFLSRFSITQRILVLTAFPLIALMCFSIFLAAKNYSEYSDAKILNEVVDTVSELSLLTHVLQVERGRTAGYLGSGGGDIPKNLSDARKEVDAEIERYHDVVEHLKTLDIGDIVTSLAAIEGELQQITDFRRNVNAGRITGGENMAFFSKIIDHILEVSLNATELASSGKVALEMVAMIDLSEAKEFAGRERGLLAGALNRGLMTTAQYVSFNNAIASQDLMLHNFIANEPRAHRAEYKNKLEETGVAEVRALRSRLNSVSGDISKAGISGAEWFETTTNRIKALRKLEMKVAKDLYIDSHKISDSAFYSMILGLVASLSVIMVSVTAGWFVTRSITNPLSGMIDSMKRISSGDLKTDVDGVELTDEIGLIARALDGFKEDAIEKLRIEGEVEVDKQKTEESRAEQQAMKAKEAEEVKAAVDVIGDALNKLAHGDLSVQIDQTFNHGLDELRVNFNSAVQILTQTLSSVQVSIDTINSNATELKSAAGSLSERTEQQAHTLQGASAAIVEITATVESSASDASVATERAASARANAKSSLDVVRSAVASMERIKQASEEIASIIEVIDEISFQTNLLALNAGVEAARAGDFGRGFAVVAQEVRELAQRSTTAAQDIKELIGRSSQEVVEGVNNVTATGTVLHNVASDVEEISSFVESIAIATKEQSIGLTACRDSVNDLDGSTQRNAAMAEESTAVTHQLAQDLATLAELVSRFKLSTVEHNTNEMAA